MDAIYRRARPDDYDAYAALFPELQTGDPTPSEATWRDEIAPHSIVCDAGGEMVGLVHHLVFGGTGYVRNLIVAPSARRQGIGRGLLYEAARDLANQGHSRWGLNVVIDNQPAISLYAQLGLKPIGRSWVLRTGWDILDRLPSITTLTAQRLTAARATVAEKKFGLLPTLLSGSVDKPNAHPIELTEANGTIRGISRFLPSFPGAWPFAVDDPALAGPLLHALAPYRDSSWDYIQLVVMDELTARVLRAAGARLHIELFRLEGNIPHHDIV